MPTPALTSATASRFFQRWQNADPTRNAQLATIAGLSLSHLLFAQLLQKETAAGLPLPRAMRRLRNLTIASLISRDLAGTADLAEVVDSMTALAEFAICTHVAALSAEFQAAHGVPIGHDSGAIQHLMVIGMGKLGGGE